MRKSTSKSSVIIQKAFPEGELSFKAKTSELNNRALDWAVSLIEYPGWNFNNRVCNVNSPNDDEYRPSIDLALGGPIIKRESITISPQLNSRFTAHYGSSIPSERLDHRYNGETPLIAAMRAFVARFLGDEVEVPTELL